MQRVDGLGESRAKAGPQRTALQDMYDTSQGAASQS